MRYVGIVLVLLAVPVLIVLLRNNRALRPYAYACIGVFPVVQGSLNLDASLWQFGGLGYVKGLVFTLLDALCIAILANTRFRVGNLPFVTLFLAYIVAVLLSILQAPGFFAPFSYAWQLLRAFLVFITVATVVQQQGGLRWIAIGLSWGAIIQGAVTTFQRLGGDMQAPGTLGHQNITGMVMHFSTLPLLALLLAGSRSKLYMAGVAGGFVTVALGASRGSIGFLGLGLALLLVLSLARRVTGAKVATVGVTALLIAAAAPVMLAGLEQRLSNLSQFGAVDEEREAFEKAAAAMFADNPLGVGANRYTLVANTEGYSERAGVFWGEGSRSAVVHNLYYLTAAELGWFGLVTLIPFLAWSIALGLFYTFRSRHDPRGDIVLGCTCALLAMALQSLYEWVFVMSSMNYAFATSLGIMAGCIVRMRQETKARHATRAAAHAASRKRHSPAPGVAA
ncbi:hypothetical protein EYB45_04720 [Erythrobacteraceae bacterium CFH 75059]|uniref:O-antigen ligase family protein n=1 Tax=Qipengyuania thermophila TaxID=2509361 RepID=UPI00102058A4|nr:O-antigen ligase family protein [Qipengyuania thermophila]TCD04850.1 hypothetical protein EYB45_04720 [Erythrobacteraceae bacterium CFH 75059]